MGAWKKKLQKLQISQHEILCMMVLPVLILNALKFEIYFLVLPQEIVFGVITGN